MHDKTLVLDAYDFQRAGDSAFSEEAFHKTAEAYGDLRDFVYQSGTSGDQNRLLDSEFAIILVLPNGDRLRKYPLNSKTDLEMSLSAFAKVYTKLPYGMVNIIIHRFSAAASRYGIEISQQPWFSALSNSAGTYASYYYPVTSGMLDTLESAMEKQAAAEPTGHYAIAHDVNGAPYTKYPINTKAQLLHAVSVLEKNAAQWISEYAIQMAQSIEKRATELKIDLGDESCVHKYAAKAYNEFAYSHVMARTTMVSDMDGYMAYRDLAEKIANRAYTPAQATVVLDNLDHANKLHYQWHARGLTRPVDAILDYPTKEAKVVSVGGMDIDVTKLQDMAANDPGALTEHLGSDIVRQLGQDAEGTLLGMPAPQRTVVMDVMGRKA